MLLNMVMFKVTICDFGKMNINMTDKIEKKEATFAVPYNGEDNNDYVDGKGFCCNDGSLEAAQTRALARAAKNNFQEGDTYEKMQFYYHPDHLGSSSYITNLDGEVVQHIAPYNGESNNCTTFVANGINNSGIGSVKEERIVDWRGLLINLNPFHKSFTPNNTYNQLKNSPISVVVKSASNKTSESYEDAIIDR